jgi:hypothetical protein
MRYMCERFRPSPSFEKERVFHELNPKSLVTASSDLIFSHVFVVGDITPPSLPPSICRKPNPTAEEASQCPSSFDMNANQ